MAVADELAAVPEPVPVALSIDEAMTVHAAGLGDVELGGLVVELTACVGRVSAAQAVAVREADRRQLARTVKLRATSSWLSYTSRIDPRTARQVVRRGRQLDHMPHVALAFGAGRVSGDHVAVLARARTERTAGAFTRGELMLVEFATTLGWGEFTQAVDYWVLVNDPDGVEPSDQSAKRFLRYHKNGDGTVRGEFCLDSVAGQGFIAAIEARAQQLFDADWADAKDRLDGEPSVSQLDRSDAQRRADALVGLVLAGGNRKAGPPLVHLVYGAELFCDQLRRLAHEVGEHTHCPPDCHHNPDQPAEPADSDQPDQPAEPADADQPAEPDQPVDPDRPDRPSEPAVPDEPVVADRVDPNRRCELVDGTPVHPTVALALALTGDVRRLVLSADGEILDLGRTVRLFPARLAAAIRAQHRGRCAQRGCDEPLHRLQIDHILPWALQGRTATRNGRPLCIWHNRTKHDRTKHDRPERNRTKRTRPPPQLE